MVTPFATPQLTGGPAVFQTSVSARRASEVLQRFQARIDLSEHQPRWTLEQRQSLILTWLLGLRVGPMTISEDTARSEIVVLDGCERFATLSAWHSGQLDTPAGWWPEGWVANRDAAVGGSVRYTDLTDLGRRRIGEHWILTVHRVHGTGDLDSVRTMLNNTRL